MTGFGIIFLYWWSLYSHNSLYLLLFTLLWSFTVGPAFSRHDWWIITAPACYWPKEFSVIAFSKYRKTIGFYESKIVSDKGGHIQAEISIRWSDSMSLCLWICLMWGQEVISAHDQAAISLSLSLMSCRGNKHINNVLNMTWSIQFKYTANKSINI